MNKSVATVVAVIIGICAIATPIAFTIYQARKLGMDTETQHALAYARDILSRSETTADQADAGIKRLAASAYEPCSDKQILQMRRIALSSSYVRVIGRVEGDRLICSSLGRHGAGWALGPVDARSPTGVGIRGNVSFDFAPATTFIVTERDNYVAIIDKNLPIDATTGRPDMMLGAFSSVTDKMLTARGAVKAEWMHIDPNQRATTFVDDGYIVAVVRSQRYYIGTIAAVPIAYLTKEVRAVSLRLVPIGLLGGLMLALAVLYLARQQLALPAVIRAALRRNEFSLVYQPIVDLRTGQWVGAEALIRWTRPNGEMVRPDIFIPVAEETGLIRQITRHVLAIVEREAWDLFRRFPHFHLSINLSSQDLQARDSVSLIQGVSQRLNAGAKNLMVEVTEHGLMQPSAAREAVKQLRAGGISMAIDDFGTGYSSLSYLETFELDYLKIDKSFVDTIGAETATSQVIPHIIEMAKALNLQMIGEGVETEVQAQYLREHGVQYAQGWLYAKAMPMEELIARLAAANDIT